MKLYVSSGCPKCEYAKGLLLSKGYDIEVINNVNEAIRLGIQSAPTLILDDGSRATYPAIIKMCREASA